jgi:ankyrin repeat/BTB/POZ domain-containing protein 1
LSEERFRLAFEDSGIEEIMNENNELNNVIAQTFPVSSPASLDEAIDVNTSERLANETASKLLAEDQILTLSGEVVDDEFAAATINHNFLMSKIDILLEKLKLDA